MDMEGFGAKERNLSGLLSQEVVDLLHLMRFKCINKDTDCLGYEIPCFVGDAPVIVFMAITEQRIEFSAKWEDRPLRSHYLLRAGFVNLPLLGEALLVLEAVWKIVISSPAEPGMDKDWDREIKDGLRWLRQIREDRVKMITETTEEGIHGKPTPAADNGARMTCGVDIKVVSKEDAEMARAMQEIEEEQI